jgi:hypothetical protein
MVPDIGEPIAMPFSGRSIWLFYENSFVLKSSQEVAAFVLLLC